MVLPQVGVTAAVQEEMSLRRQAASLVQLTLGVMNAAHVSIPALRWYIRQLADAQPKATQFKVKVMSEHMVLTTEFCDCIHEDGIIVKGGPEQRHKMASKHRQCVQNFHGSCTSIYGTKLFFACLGEAMLVHSLTMKSRKRWAHDVMYISATHAYLVHDV